MIKSVLKAIKIMRLFNEAETRLSLADICHQLDIPKSTAHNILNTLLSEGFIEKVDGELYALGTASLVLTQNIRVNVEIRDPAAPWLRKLADQTRESVLLTVRDGAHVLYIYAIESPQRLLARTAVGDRAPLHCTAVGKGILAYLPEEEVDELFARIGMQKFTAHTITDLGVLKKELEETRARGYSLDRGEHEDGVYCIGAPIFNRRKNVIAACSVSGTDPEILKARLDDLAGQVIHTTGQISRLMGYIPVPGYRSQ